MAFVDRWKEAASSIPLGHSNLFLCFALPWLIGFGLIFQKEKKGNFIFILFFSVYLLHDILNRVIL